MITVSTTAALPTAYLWAGDGYIEGQSDNPVMGRVAPCGHQHGACVAPAKGQGKPDEYLFRKAVRQIKAMLG